MEAKAVRSARVDVPGQGKINPTESSSKVCWVKDYNSCFVYVTVMLVKLPCYILLKLCFLPLMIYVVFFSLVFCLHLEIGEIFCFQSTDPGCDQKEIIEGENSQGSKNIGT